MSWRDEMLRGAKEDEIGSRRDMPVSLWRAHYASLRLASRELLDAQAAMMNAAVVDDDFPAERNRFNAAMAALGRALDAASEDPDI